MTDQAPDDLFPGFETQTVQTDLTTIHCRTGGKGPPLLLLHGYPQTHVMWHRIAPSLAANFTLVIPDLPGYGASSIPPLGPGHEAYSKRSMARAMVSVMETLGHSSFALAGHDRGARVAYRLALDHPDTVKKLAVLDILPTHDYWQRMDREFALKIYHWAFLAQPAPFPEQLISASAIPFLEHTLASWTASKSLAPFSAGALNHYRAMFADPARVAATCEDYRAGATVDVRHDAEDLAQDRRILAPTLALWGETGIAQSGDTPLTVWQRWCRTCTGAGIPGGHFLPEEAPDAVVKALLGFF